MPSLFPLELLPDASEFEAELIDDQIVVRAKTNDDQTAPERKTWLHDLIGIYETSDPTASSCVEDILAGEIDRRAGWTLDPNPDRK